MRLSCQFHPTYISAFPNTGRYPIMPCFLSVCFDDAMHGSVLQCICCDWLNFIDWWVGSSFEIKQENPCSGVNLAFSPLFVNLKKLIHRNICCDRLHFLDWSHPNSFNTYCFLTGNLLPHGFKVSLHVILIDEHYTETASSVNNMIVDHLYSNNLALEMHYSCTRRSLKTIVVC